MENTHLCDLMLIYLSFPMYILTTFIFTPVILFQADKPTNKKCIMIYIPIGTHILSFNDIRMETL